MHQRPTNKSNNSKARGDVEINIDDVNLMKHTNESTNRYLETAMHSKANRIEDFQ